MAHRAQARGRRPEDFRLRHRRGIAESLSDDRLEIEIVRSPTADDETRVVRITPLGPRWLGTTPAVVLGTASGVGPVA